MLSGALVGVIVALAGSVATSSASIGTKAATTPTSSVAPVLLGAAKAGATIAASTGVWSGSAPIVFTYQWQRCDASGANCLDVGPASAATRIIAAESVGSSLRVVVTASNAAGAQTATSQPSAVVVAAADGAPHATVRSWIQGDGRVGQRLRIRAGQWKGSTPLHYAIKWQRCDSTGADCVALASESTTYYPVAADVGHTIRAIVAVSNSAGTNSAVTAQKTVVSGTVAPVNTVPSSITGLTRPGENLSAHPGTWTGGSISFGYQWQRCDASGGSCGTIAGAVSATYRTTPGDTGHTIRLLVTAKNAAGSATLLSRATPVISSSGPAATVLPRISGTAKQGAVLTVVRGGWSGSSPIAVGFQWLRCDSAGNNCGTVQNAIGTTYRLTVSDVNHRLRVAATGVNSVGRSTVLSNPTALVQPSAPVNKAQPTISGKTRQGSTLTANPGVWGSVSAITYSYQWTRCNSSGHACSPIAGHIGVGQRTYTVTGADVGHRIFVQVRASNSYGVSFVNSPQTVIVGAAAGPPPPPPTTGATVPVTSVTAPDRLLVDKVQFLPSRIHNSAQPLIARVHVIEASGRKPVSGVLVYAVGVPFDRLSGQGEVVTDATGWATVSFQVLPTFQLRPGNLVVVFVRARKPGENPLGGISTRRLISVRVGR